MRAINVIGTEENLVANTSSATATSVQNAILLRIIHVDTANRDSAKIYRINAAGTELGSFTIDHLNTPVYLFKDPSDKIYGVGAGLADMYATPITFMY
jgi:hypothetical protein